MESGCPPAWLVSEKGVFLLSCPEPPIAGPRCLRGSPWGSRDPEDKLGPRGAENASPPVLPDGREETPLPSRRAPPSRVPPPPGEAPEAVPPAAAHTHLGTAAEDAPAEGSKKEPSRDSPQSRARLGSPAPAGCRGPTPVLPSQRRPGNIRTGSDVRRRRAQKEAGPRLRAGPRKSRGPRAAEEEAGGRTNTEAAESHFEH